MSILSSIRPKASLWATLPLLFAFGQSVSADVLDIRITELMYNPPGGDAYEFLELANTGGGEVDLSGASFGGISHTFPAGSTLAAGKVVVLISDANPGAFRQRYPAVQPFGIYSARLANSGERISLRDSLGRTITSVEYGDSGFWPKSADGGGHSLELLSSAVEPNDPGAWQASLATLGSPGVWNAAARQSPVRISEFMALNMGSVPHGNGFPDWVEFENTTAELVPLAGWSFTDSSGDAARFTFPADAAIPGRGRLVVWLSQPANSPGLNASFGLDRNNGTLALFNPQLAPVDVVSYGQLPGDHTLAWIDGQWRLGQPTPEIPNVAANTVPPQGIKLNEWYADSMPGEADWLELFHADDGAIVDLRGARIGTESALFEIRSPNFLTPGEFIRLWADENPGARHLDFKLPASGTTLTLTSSSGGILDTVTYGPQSEGISQGKLPDGSPNLVFFPQGATPGSSNDSDKDNDGLPDFWELLHQLDPENPGDAALDSDGDTMSNLAEYLAGTLPRDIRSVLKLDIARGPQGVTLSFPGQVGKTYSILSSGALGAGIWNTTADFEASTTQGMREWLLGAPGGAGRFFEVATPKRKNLVHPVEPQSPTPGSVAVSPATPIHVLFASSLNPASVNTQSFRLTDDLGRAVPGSFRFEDNFQSVRFVPAVPLLSSTTYQLAVGDGLATANGAPLNWSTNFLFSTAESAPLVDNLGIYPQNPTEVALGHITTFEYPGGHTWEDLLMDQYSGDAFSPMIEVSFQEGDFGQAQPAGSTGVLKVRGQSTRLTGQKSLKLELFDRAGLWRGQRELNLNKHPYDLSRIRNKVAFDLLAGIPHMTSLRTLFVGLTLNGESLGLFTHVENPDKRFLASHGLDGSGHLYKPKFFEFYQYPSHLKSASDPEYSEQLFEQILEIKGSRDHQKLLAMLADLNNDDIPFDRVMAKHFNADNAITWFATTILLGNLDTRTQNYYLYSPSNSATWHFLPWDFDGGFDFYGMPVEAPNHKDRHVLRGLGNWWGSVFHRRFIQSPELMARLLDRVDSIYQDRMTPEKMSALIEPLRAVARPWISTPPDRYSLPVVDYDESEAEWEVEIERLKTRPHYYKTNLLEVIKRPMPMFLGNPEPVGDSWRFAWDNSFDLQGDPFLFDFELSRGPSFAAGEIVVRQAGLAETSTSVAKTLAPAGTYFWRVIVRQTSDPATQWEIPFDNYWDATAGKAYYGLRQWVVE